MKGSFKHKQLTLAVEDCFFLRTSCSMREEYAKKYLVQRSQILHPGTEHGDGHAQRQVLCLFATSNEQTAQGDQLMREPVSRTRPFNAELCPHTRAQPRSVLEARSLPLG